MRDIKSSTSKRQVYRKGEVKGLKRGILIGSVSTILIAGMGQLGYTNLTTKRYTPSYVAGFEVPSDYTHRTEDKRNFYYDFGGIAGEFDPETMDFDSYIYGAFCRFPVDTRVDNMDSLIKSMHVFGYTDYDGFLSYCRDKGLVEVVNGEEKINIKKYIQEVKKYMATYNKKEELEEEMSGFRRA